MAWIETAAVLALFAARVISVRRTVAVVVAVSVACALVALVVSHPSRAALERHLRHGPGVVEERRLAGVVGCRLDRPLLGYGPGRFSAIYDEADSRSRVALAHNAVLEQAVESGIFAAAGTAVALAAMLLAGARVIASREPRRLSAGVAASAVALSGLYDFTWSFAPLLLLGAISALACRRPDE